MARTIEVTMSVTEIIGPSDGVDDTVTWETDIGPPSTFDLYAQGWHSIGSLVVFLSEAISHHLAFIRSPGTDRW
jgi:hypothetical protein